MPLRCLRSYTAAASAAVYWDGKRVRLGGDIMPWFDYVNSVGIIGALGVGAFQTRRLVADARSRDASQRIENALALYRDLVVDGDTANAFHRLSVLLRSKGAEQHGITTWYVINDDDFKNDGLFDPALTGFETPFADFYRVLWFFERAEMNLRFELANSNVFFNAAGFHCWWWGQLLHAVEGPKATAAIRRLAPKAVAWAKKNGVYAEWKSHCKTDFDGGPGIDM